jgi:hypothetical protein
MGGHRGHAEAAIHADRRQRIGVAGELRKAVVGVIGRTGAGGMRSVVERPNGLQREVRRLAGADRMLRHVVEPRRHHREPGHVDLRRLMRRCTDLARPCIGGQRRRGSERRNGLRDRHDHQRFDEGPGSRTCRLVVGQAHLICSAVHGLAVSSAGTQPAFGDQHAARRQQPELEEVASAGQPSGDQLSPVLRGGEHFPIPRLGHLFAEDVVIHGIISLPLSGPTDCGCLESRTEVFEILERRRLPSRLRTKRERRPGRSCVQHS